jgi:transposase InsO family protein
MNDRSQYNGCRMNYGTIFPKADRLARTTSLSKTGLKRLEYIDWYQAHGQNAELTCRHFGISKSVFYRWKNRFSKHNLAVLESRSRRPHQTRHEEIPSEVVSKILELKKEYPRWGKAKLKALLWQQHPEITVSESSVGRVLKRRGLVNLVGLGHRKHRRISYQGLKKARASRLERDLAPGHQVQIDVKYYQNLNQMYYRFTAIDTKTRIKFARVYGSKTANVGRVFLEEIKPLFPFPIETYQTDNGSEFLAEFHAWVVSNHQTHFFTYAYTPQMNGRVERVIRTDSEEFWDFKEPEKNLTVMNKLAAEWDYVYNYVRPHQSLGNKTPMQYYEDLTAKSSTVLNVLN